MSQKRKKEEAEKIHNEKAERINNAINVAKGHQEGQTTVIGGAEPYKQAQRDALELNERLEQENIDYNNIIDDIEKLGVFSELCQAS